MSLSSLGRPRVVEGLRLVELVGQGGEGEVWEARDARGRLRALKLVRPECLADPDEAATRGAWLVRIDHPALVRVHRSGVLDVADGGPGLAGWGFVEMDFIDGESLARAPGDPSVLQRLAPLAEALDLLHAGAWSDGVPLVHRDVKPANIVVARDGRFVLVDPSTLRGADATHVTRVGTPVFNAPEVATGRIGPAADVYSFAATVVALATGLRGGELADAIADARRLDLPAGVRLALSAHPGDRPVSCRDVLDDSAAMTIPLPVPVRHADPDPDAANSWDTTVALYGPAPAAVVPRERTLQDGAPESGARRGWSAPDPSWRGPATRALPAVADRYDPASPAAHEVPYPAGAARYQAPYATGAARYQAPYATEAARYDPAHPFPPQPPGPPIDWRRPRAVVPWLVALLAASGLAAVAALAGAAVPAALGLPVPPPLPSALGRPAVVLAAGGAGLHLLAHLLAGRWLHWAVLLPPLAWASLLADRAGGTRRRRAWTRAVTMVGATLIAAAPVLAWRSPLVADPPAAALLLGTLVISAGVVGARGGSPVAAALRVLALPAWAAGAVVLVGLAVLALPLGLFVGAAPRLVRSIGTTLASVVETGRPPAGAERGWRP